MAPEAVSLPEPFIVQVLQAKWVKFIRKYGEVLSVCTEAVRVPVWNGKPQGGSGLQGIFAGELQAADGKSANKGN